jgi:hypothetical protein
MSEVGRGNSEWKTGAGRASHKGEEGVSVAFGSVGGGSVWKRRFNRQVAKEEEGDFGWERGRLATS